VFKIFPMRWKMIFLNVGAIVALAIAMELFIAGKYLNDLAWLGLILLPLIGGLYFRKKYYPQTAYTLKERTLVLRIGGGLVAFSLLWLAASVAYWSNGLPRGSIANVIFSVFFFPLMIGLLLIFMAIISRSQD
jgi:hypothetical protein